MNNKQWDAIWLCGSAATMKSTGYDLIQDAAMGVEDGKIAWIGKKSDLPGLASDLAHAVFDVGSHCITPGLIDCHTHLVYAGNRANEFELRLQGATYEAIAKAGGGIRSTVAATRAATE
jgi:imidazolonepropionase